MKKFINISLAMMLALTFACSSDISMEGYTPPKLKTTVKCIFPQEAQEQGIEGKTTVIVQIDDEGNVYYTKVAESSGYNVLDLAAMDYCNRLKFQPARWGDKEIGAKIEMEVDFKFADRHFDVNRYFFKVRRLTREIKNAAGDSRYRLLNELLDAHREYIEKMQTGVDFNKYMEDVILSSIANEWEYSWDSYPLTFLLYHDFLQRYPDFADADKVKKELKSALQKDIYVISNSRVISSARRELRDNLLEKIESFTKKYYPDFNFRSLNSNMKKYTTQASF